MKVRKYFDFNIYNYKDIELKLEKLASQGLMLEKCGAMFWTFKEEQPKKLKFTVTCFSEGSIFNPSITLGQQVYIDNAKLKGWTFVTNLNRMHIFYTEHENSQPIEDHIQRFNNIKKYMNKSFVPITILQILVFGSNLIRSYNSLKDDPIRVLSDSMQMINIVLFLNIIIFWIFILSDYFIWYVRSKKSIANKGGCVNTTSKTYKIIKVILMIIMFGSLGLEICLLIFKKNWFVIIFMIIQLVLVYGVYLGIIKYLRKRKVEATTNRIVSTLVLIVVTFVYLFFIAFVIGKAGFLTDGRLDYRKVQLQIPYNETHEFLLYNDNIPLKCEDLYEGINYENYSYEKKVDATIFITKTSYEQVPLPEKDAPPRLSYTIIEPKFDFVYNLAKEELLKIPDYRDNTTLKPIDNSIFKTIDAYQEAYRDKELGKYILFYKNKIITLNLDKPATENQVLVIIDKLG